MTAASANINNKDKDKDKSDRQDVLTNRRNSLADMDFNIIADTIRCQNLKKQMNLRLMSLKRNLTDDSAQNIYSGS